MVYQLLRQGRLYFNGGGWSMTDEATTSYHAIIDHFTYSLRKINATFLECGRPLVTWQADVFGHTREFASLMAQMGFDAHFISPISYDDELARMRSKSLEFVWRGSDDLGPSTDIYTHKLFDGFWAPPGFCFGQFCHDPLIITSDKTFANVEERTGSSGDLRDQ
uniref:SFRICE_031420 n=1 Tax=Spodoptera frugiperda TaxID=7108 RepID=A0A2H1W4M7_SPOFR